MKSWILILTALILSACTTLGDGGTAFAGNLALQEIEVEIQGEIHRPGIYVLPKKATLRELVEQAGGFTERADSSLFNLNQILSHRDVVVIEPKKEIERISINTATAKQLQSLPGIGPSTAMRIIEYRETHGLFQSIEELDHVKGIGPKKLEKLRDYVKL